MEQKADESDLAFITRVGTAARLCNYGKEKEFEEIVGTIAAHAQRREVRTMALKLLGRNGTFSDLVDKVREIEAIRLNEQFFAQKHGSNNATVVAPVRTDFPMRGGGQQRYPGRATYQRGNRSISAGARRGGYQGMSRNTGARTGLYTQRNNEPQATRCWRCTSVYHVPARCHAVDKDCRKCGQLGHIQIACPLPPAAAFKKQDFRVQESVAESSQGTIAAVEKSEDTAATQEVSEKAEYYSANVHD